ncbi:MAG: hypothetical protein IJ805_00865, partial [Lachnospiraceae bacterium]|nr:hypothetical protein [Lachnospiraceae bacterium]
AFYFKENAGTIRLPLDVPADRQWVFTYTGEAEDYYVRYTPPSGTDDNTGRFVLNGQDVTVEAGKNADSALLDTSRDNYLSGDSAAISVKLYASGKMLRFGYEKNDLWQDTYRIMPVKENAGEVIENVDGNATVPAIRQKEDTSGFLYASDANYPVKKGTVLTADDDPFIVAEAKLQEAYLYYDEEASAIGYAPVTIWAVRDKPDTEDDESLYAGWDEARENIVIRGSEDYEYLILKSVDEIPDRSTEASGTLVKSGSIYSRTEEKEAGDYKVYVRRRQIAGTSYSSDWSDAVEVSSPKDVTLTFDNAVNDKIEFDYRGINKTLEDKLAVTSSNTAGYGTVKVTVIKNTTDNRKIVDSIKKAGKAAQETLEKIDGHKYHTDKGVENGKYIAVANFIPDDQNVYKLEKIVTADVVINKAKAVAEVRFTGTLKNCHGEILNGDEISFLDFKVLIEDKANNSYETLTLSNEYSIVLAGGTGGNDNGDYVLNGENSTVSVNEFNGSRLLVYVRKDDAELKEMSDWSENPGCYELVTGPDSNYETLTVLNKTGDHITITKNDKTMRYETAHNIIGDNENDVIGSFVSVRHGTAPVIDLAPGNLKFTYSLSENTGFADISTIKDKLNAGNTIYVSANSPKLDLSTDKPVSFKIEKSVISVNLYNGDHPDYDFESYKGYEDDVKELNYSGKVITTLENGETPAAGTAYGNIGGNGAHNFSSILSGSSSTVKVDNVNCNIAGDYGVYITPAALNESFSGNYILKDSSVPGIWQVKDSYMVRIVNADTGRIISDKNIVLADNPDYTVPASIAGSFAKWYLKTRSGSRLLFDVNTEETDIIQLCTKNDDGSITFHIGIFEDDIKNAGTVTIYASNIINAVIDQTKTELKVAPIKPVIYTGLKHVAALDGSKNKNLMADINLSVTLGNSKEELTYGVDYKVSYKNNVDAHDSDTADIAKTPKVIITGIGDYKGLKTEAAFTILKADLSDSAELTINTPYSKYTDKGLSPKVTLKDTRNSKKLTQGKDFELKFYDKATGKAVDQTAYSKTSSAQKFIVVAEARSDSKNYTGSTKISDKDAVIWGIPAASKKLKASKTLNTIKYDASKYPDGVPASAFAADAVVKAGSTVLDSRRLTFELYDKDKHLIRDRLDTSTILKNAKDAGTYYLKIAVNESDPLVDGVFYEPVFVKVNYKGTKLKNLLRLGDNSKKFAYGTAQGKLKLIPSKEGVTVNAGSILVTYYSLNDTEVYRYGTLPLYSGKLDTFESGSREWTLNRDHTQYIQTGSYTITLQGARQYEGEDSLKYTVNSGKASDLAKSGLLKVSLKNTTVSYDASGERFKDNVVVTLDGGSLSRGTDYTVSYRLTGSGTANMCSLTVKGKNRFTGSITTGSFIVKGAKLNSSDVKALVTSTPASAKVADVVFYQNGTALKKNKDYVVSEAVDGVCTAEGRGYFAGSSVSLNVPVCEGEVRKVEFMPDATGLSYNEALRSMPVPVNVRVTYKDGSVITISEDAIDKYFYTCYEYNNKRFALLSSDGEDTGHTGDAVISSTGEDKLPIGKNMTMLIIPKSGSGVEKLMPSSSISSLEDAIKYRGAAAYKCKYKISITEK